MSFIRHIEASLLNAVKEHSKLPKEILSLSGFSSARVRYFLNNVCSFPAVNYLEIGTWKGSTLLSASYKNEGQFTGIDNFSEFSSPREEFQSNKERFRDLCHFTFHDADCWELDLALIPKEINVFFYDGHHSFESQRDVFLRYNPCFSETFLAIIDDWNWEPTREGTRSAFLKLKYQALFEKEFFTRENCSENDWWNGLLVAVLKKPNDIRGS